MYGNITGRITRLENLLNKQLTGNYCTYPEKALPGTTKTSGGKESQNAVTSQSSNLDGKQQSKPYTNQRTSMQILINGPQAGTSNIPSGMLVLPEEMFANNKYYVSTIPPCADFTITVRNVLDNSTSVLAPLISRN